MGKASGFSHAEAFALMTYRCQACGFEERIWNSRDGVTPFGIDCRRCGKDAQHADWGSDLFAPHYDPLPGDRDFRDGLPEEARAFMRARLEQGRGTPYAIPEEDWPEFIKWATKPDYVEMPDGSRVPSGEFQPGWPHLVVRGTDADSLGPSRQVEPPSPEGGRG